MLAFMSAAAAMFADAGTSSTAAARPSARTVSGSPYGPAAPTPAPKVPAKTEAASEACQNSSPSPGSQEIVVCAIKPDGYRLNPDVMEAKRELRRGGRPVRPGQVPNGNSCATVGPMGCRGVPTINLLAVAATAGKIADRLSKGEEIGSIFVTDPHPSEYQLYLEAKKAREAKEAEKKAAAEKVTIKDNGQQPTSDQRASPALPVKPAQ